MLEKFLKKYMYENKEKLFWQIVKGITGRNYSEIKDIAERDRKDTEKFLKKKHPEDEPSEQEKKDAEDHEKSLRGGMEADFGCKGD